MTTRLSSRIFGSFAGLFGASGVALAAAGAHLSGSAAATTAAHFLLFHAAALLGLCAVTQRRSLWFCTAGGGLLVCGTILFSGDLALRSLADITLVHMAAPTGGVLMVLGWLALAIALPVELGNGDSN